MSPLYVFFALLIGLSSARYYSEYYVVNNDLPPIWSEHNFRPIDDGWLMLHKQHATWHEASRICEGEGAVLASPTTDGLHSQMKNIIEFDRIHYIHTGIMSNSYLGQGSVDYLSTYEFGTGRTTSERPCVAMRSSGVLEDVDCNSKRAFICHRMAVKTTGYVKNNETGSSYKFHKTGATWDQANATCKEEGGHLAIINSEKEAKALMDLLHNVECKSEYVHIGFYNEARFNGGVYGEWLTVGGQTLQRAGFTRWSDGEPNNYLGKELCGNIIYKYYFFAASLNDYSCTELVPFICEIESSDVVAQYRLLSR